ncbi:MAG: YARHG domain-containing protein [Prevotella sp.]|nr:YARHG domain-containing protein [Prevotella sp.]
MKKVLSSIILCLCAVLGAQAQIDGGNWYNGWLVYSADLQDNGKIVMNAMAEGEEHEFMLVPVAGKKETYRVTDGPNGYVDEFHATPNVRHLKGNGLDALCFYNDKNQLEKVMTNESEWESEIINKKRWLAQVYGEYASEEENDVEKVLNWDKHSLSLGGIVLPYEVLTFNGLIIDTGIIHIKEVPGSTNELEGTWKVVATLKGLDFIALDTSKGTMPWDWQPTGVKYTFGKTDQGQGRFAYTSKIVLNDKLFAKLDKKTLRIMRNEILARHGYRF